MAPEHEEALYLDVLAFLCKVQRQLAIAPGSMNFCQWPISLRNSIQQHVQHNRPMTTARESRVSPSAVNKRQGGKMSQKALRHNPISFFCSGTVPHATSSHAQQTKESG
eukprot:95352-Rhodomonas_salina.1